ncbi:hypothetical protein B0H17DRAFT_1141763 [Mycena rosella]|uniref:HTH CENPB-type domain-containing protein n=1 Tax=Mycena rosella TaxID=1033263 RepID=A0AAD7CZ95_MYCRO|nr:hypothetical protein B0H17DRAFT_1141763 [Mycena rosella]
MPPPIEKTRKPRAKPAEPYRRGEQPKKDKNTPKTSAQPVQDDKRWLLTLADWLVVYAFVDEHPNMTQEAVTNHFKTLATGPLIFSQETLSRRLKQRGEVETRVTSNPTALFSKRKRIVTHPDVERGLVMWVAQIEGKGETVTGDMLVEKRRWLEEAFDVPNEQRLSNCGWLGSFLKT